MNDETKGALKRVVEEVKEKRHAKCLNIDCVVNHQIGGNDIDLVESWMKTSLDQPVTNAVKFAIRNEVASVYWLEGDELMYAPMFIDGTFNTEEGGAVERELVGSEIVPNTAGKTFNELYDEVIKSLNNK